MVPPLVARQRLVQQRLAGSSLASAAEVVAWFGAVQAQDYLGAKWSLGMRMTTATDEGIDAALDAGAILRTHALRPTWHFVAPADIRWILALTAPRVNAMNAYQYRQFELDDALFVRSNAAIANALRGGTLLTRSEIGAVLADAGIVAAGIRLGYILHRAELDAVVCSGPRRGKQITYVLLEERAPNAVDRPRNEALAELTRRYFAAHGPATLHDFAWWSGLTVADAKTGLATLSPSLTSETIDGQTYWFTADLSPGTEAGPKAWLLPTYDEFLVGFRGFGQATQAGRSGADAFGFTSTIVVDGRVVGSWRRSYSNRTVAVELAPVAPLTEEEDEAVQAAVRRYGDFVGMPVTMIRVKNGGEAAPDG